MRGHRQTGTLCQPMEFRCAKTDLRLIIMDNTAVVRWARQQVLMPSSSCNSAILLGRYPVHRGGNCDIEVTYSRSLH